MKQLHFILARRHDSEKWEVVAGPETPLHEQRAEFQNHLLAKSNEVYAEVRRGWFHPDQGVTRMTSKAAQKAAEAEAKRIASQNAIFERAQKERAELARINKLPKLERDAALKALKKGEAKAAHTKPAEVKPSEPGAAQKAAEAEAPESQPVKSELSQPADPEAPANQQAARTKRK